MQTSGLSLRLERFVKGGKSECSFYVHDLHHLSPQLVHEIQRAGHEGPDGTIKVTFGELLDHSETKFEALLGTLLMARKHKVCCDWCCPRRQCWHLSTMSPPTHLLAMHLKYFYFGPTGGPFRWGRVAQGGQ